MPKFRNNRYFFSKLDLQLFAEGGGDDAGDDAGDGGDQDDDQDDSDSDKDGEEERKYTQADLDKAVARTIAKERRKAERAAARQKNETGNSEKNKDGSDDSEDVKARKAAESKASRLEVKVACFEAGVTKDAIDDVAALAHAYMEADDALDLEEAIEKVVKKYPHFKTGSGTSEDDAEEKKGKSWGERQKGRKEKLTGVEAAFLKKNPGLKI